ncbi:MAG: polysaccharide biosynthesis/export family protein [Bacteroidales bacterium]|nr:polysaccharide biosynthesis/export family protein [Bacteroidales bacterium]MBN2763881.1 polysaccharide biosynthesis/export family protein [Bacteroidales bacterium]
MNTLKSIIFKLFVLMVFSLFMACTPVKKLRYVSQVGHETDKSEYFNDRSEKTIQPYDYLYVKIYSLDERTNSIFNDRYSSALHETELISYAVDDKGNINLPFIGVIKVKDLTINQAKEQIEKSLGVYLNNISVVVRYVSNKVTVLGEIARPGQYSFFDEKITVFQAIGFASGTTPYGNLSDVTLIREKDDVIKYHYLDLTNKNIVASEYYYLLPNDIIIINPINAKYRELRDYTLQIVSSLLGSVTTLLSSIILYQSLTSD